MERQMSSPDISTGLDTIINYKFGRIDLNEAVYQFLLGNRFKRGNRAQIYNRFITR